MSDDLRPAPDETARPDDPEALEALARDVLPALIARLGSSGLGELEVATDAWRVRLRRSAASTTSPSTGAGPGASPEVEDGPAMARSPGVGYFDPAEALVVGGKVAQGDGLGSVEVLGVKKEVIAPADGVIGRIHVQPGEAVEFGQALASIGAAHATSSADVPEATVAD